MIEIIPAIDIIGGRCVRLSQGDYNRLTIYDSRPEEIARRMADAGVGRIHVVDLDGAKSGAPANLRSVEAIASLGVAEIELGGGLKSDSALRSAFDAGATYAIGGSIAVKDQPTFAGWLRSLGPQRIILGADVRDGRVATDGWLADSPLTAADLIDRFRADGLTQAICTDIASDGMLKGPATEFYTGLSEMFPDVTVTVSGGISSMDDIMRLDDLGLKRVIVGKAIYEGHITLKQIEHYISTRG
ncbi:1-(5-phosphoribosyl)-5-[(5-phosphoribosylamino)methylideneamino]imidazole-4-carboxamide isomerase [Paramuribaculum intestinale]|uniref:1-(5-phosphoribosyl)-5-[(5- phosphoribosylamino)methylideneamino]imidazole-4- carboxamide isomerase n=1 Tax=Paramuribaculum intestinale TaxID=2094151 RepID=UPI0025A9ACB7|nr:1-(5-phosphoribosyl)-5-[(5-phosphoribosylamino)methylideneamino]imidazole-4-carboxamide isomerase [Paramuribaculum intestinale]